MIDSLISPLSSPYLPLLTSSLAFLLWHIPYIRLRYLLILSMLGYQAYLASYQTRVQHLSSQYHSFTLLHHRHHTLIFATPIVANLSSHTFLIDDLKHLPVGPSSVLVLMHLSSSAVSIMSLPLVLQKSTIYLATSSTPGIASSCSTIHLFYPWVRCYLSGLRCHCHHRNGMTIDP
jgi:hypothetical protein